MASSFKRYTSRDVGTAQVSVGSYTVPANTSTTVIGMTFSNVSNSAIDITAVHVDTSNNQTHIVKTAPVPVGSSLVAVGGSQKIVLETGDSIQVSASANTSVDVIMSVLEVS